MKKNAFTFIEILVVVAIIGLLASIVIPSIIRAKNKARYENPTVAEIAKSGNTTRTASTPEAKPEANNVIETKNNTIVSVIVVGGKEYIIAERHNGYGNAVAICPR